MPFVSLPNLPSWPRSKPPTPLRSRQTSVDLKTVSEEFGVPAVDDPDPFGVLALERAGLAIKEAGTKIRPSSDTFEFRPSPSSPVFRNSFQSAPINPRDSRRDSRKSTLSIDHGTQTADPPTPEPDSIYLSPTQIAAADTPSPIHENEHIEQWPVELDNTPEDSKRGSSYRSPLRESWTVEGLGLRNAGTETAGSQSKQRPRSASQRLRDTMDRLERDSQPPSKESSPVDGKAHYNDVAVQEGSGEDNITQDLDEDDLDESVIVENVVQAAPALKLISPSVVSPTVARAKLVTIKGRPAPALPARNPRRVRAKRAENAGGLAADGQDESSSAYSPSPTRSAFDRSDDHASIPSWSEPTSLQEGSVKSRRDSNDLAADGDAEGSLASTKEVDDATAGPTAGKQAPQDSEISHEQSSEKILNDTQTDSSLTDTMAHAHTPTNESKPAKPFDLDVILGLHPEGSPSVSSTLHSSDYPIETSAIGLPEPTTPHKPTENASSTLHEQSPTTPHASQLPFASLAPVAAPANAQLDDTAAPSDDAASISDYSHADDDSHADDNVEMRNRSYSVVSRFTDISHVHEEDGQVEHAPGAANAEPPHVEQKPSPTQIPANDDAQSHADTASEAFHSMPPTPLHDSEKLEPVGNAGAVSPLDKASPQPPAAAAATAAVVS